MSELTHNITDIARCAAQFRTEELAPLGLKACHGSYLAQICACPGITQDQLAQRIFINKSNVARQLAILEEDGFVERRPCSEDKRAMRVYPTQKALDVLPRIHEILLRWEQLLTQDLSEEEKQLLGNMLCKMKSQAANWMDNHER